MSSLETARSVKGQGFAWIAHKSPLKLLGRAPRRGAAFSLAHLSGAALLDYEIHFPLFQHHIVFGSFSRERVVYVVKVSVP